MPLTVNGEEPTRINYNGNTVYRVYDQNSNLVWPDFPNVISRGSITVTLGTYDETANTGGKIILPYANARLTRANRDGYGSLIGVYEGIETSFMKVHFQDEDLLSSGTASQGNIIVHPSLLSPVSVSGIPSGYEARAMYIEEENKVVLPLYFYNDTQHYAMPVNCQMLIYPSTKTAGFVPSSGTFYEIAEAGGMTPPWKMKLLTSLFFSLSYDKVSARFTLGRP